MKGKMRGHEPLRVPNNWSAQDRAFVIQLERILDDLYMRSDVLAITKGLTPAQIEQAQENLGISQVYVKEVTDTTTDKGNLNLKVAHSKYVLIGALCTTVNTMCIPCKYSSTNWGVHIRQIVSGTPIVASTSVTVRAYFVPVSGAQVLA